jgi:UDP-glucuronate decarboxylase
LAPLVTTRDRHRVVVEDLERIAAEPLPWQRLHDATVVVTGGAGLIASYLIEAILFANEHRGRAPTRVIATVRNVEAARERFAAYTGRADLEIIAHDVASPLPEIGRMHYLVHAAGQATPSQFGRDPVGTYAPNVLGTHHLLERAHRDGTVGALFLSSGAVHGELPPSTDFVREDVYGVVDPLDPRASYAESKRMGETICRSWFTQFGVPVRIARLGHTYGPGMRRTDERAFAQFVFSVVDGKDIVLNSDGSAVRPYCYLADATSALLRILLAGADGEAYFVVNPSASCSVRELAELLAGLAPAGRVSVRRSDGASPNHYLPNRDPARPVDIAKIRALGWQPTIGLREGFVRTIESYL